MGGACAKASSDPANELKNKRTESKRKDGKNKKLLSE